MDKIILEDIKFYGYHGVNPAERESGQWFSVDVELYFDANSAIISDDITDTVDYSEVYRRVINFCKRKKAKLLEKLAGMIADDLIRNFPINEVMVKVKKIHPPIKDFSGTVSVCIRRTR